MYIYIYVGLCTYTCYVYGQDEEMKGSRVMFKIFVRGWRFMFMEMIDENGAGRSYGALGQLASRGGLVLA
jgi:hypothetical protein